MNAAVMLHNDAPAPLGDRVRNEKENRDIARLSFQTLDTEIIDSPDLKKILF